MQSVLFYLLKVIACSAIFVGYYWCFLRNGRFYKWNRFYLLFSTIGSIIIPLVNIPVYITNEIPQPTLYENVDVAELSGAVLMQVQSGINYLNILISMYCLIVFVFLGIDLKNLLSIRRLKYSAKTSTVNNIKIYNTDSESAPFSFFNSVFWKTDIDIASADGQRILQHELAHIKAKHSHDKMLVQLICVIFWMNPVFWLLKRELSLVHEYEADSACIKDNDVEKLSALILCTLYPSHYLEFTNQFFQSPIKRRLIMLSQNKKNHYTLLRQLMFVPVAAVVLCAFALRIEAKPVFVPDNTPEPIPLPQPIPEPDTIKQQKKAATTYKYAKNSTEVIPFAIVPTKPKFQDGDARKFPAWVQSQAVYPAEANISGTVYVQFVIDVDGTLTDFTLLRKVSPLLDEEALRAIKSSPQWTPGKDKNGKVVPVSYQLPVAFKTQGSVDAKSKSDTPAVKTSYTKREVVPFALVPTKPKFQDGDARKFTTWAQSQAVYPEEAATQKISGTVYVQFTVDVDGTLTDFKLLRKVNSLLDEEALRAVKSSPQWTPGKDKNENIVPVSYQIPIQYKL